MARHKSRAFVLSASDYRETSRLLQLFCENEGRISVIARGLRSPRSKKAQIADAFNLLQVNYTLKDGATLGQLTGLEAEELFSGLRANLQSYALANFWFEILKVAGQSRIASHDVFDLTRRFLKALADNPPEETLVSQATKAVPEILLMLDLARELGFAMQTMHCNVCGGTDELRRFSISSGVAVCASCPAPSGRSVVAPQALGPAAVKGAFLQLYNEYMATHLEHRFYTFEFLREILGPR